MGKGFAAKVKRVIEQSDVLLEVIDARFPNQTRNRELEKLAVRLGKGLIVVANKCDVVGLAEARELRKAVGKRFPCVLVSAKLRSGKRRLLRAIGVASKKKRVVVGVVGYPNTGKSSVVNMLKGSKTALTSRKAGFTRGEQFFRVSEKVLLIDTPGVIPIEERDEFKLFLVGAKNQQELHDRELTAFKLIEFLLRENPVALQRRYGLKRIDSYEKALEQIALRRKKFLKGGKPDTEAAAAIVLGDWSKGVLR